MEPTPSSPKEYSGQPVLAALVPRGFSGILNGFSQSAFPQGALGQVANQHIGIVLPPPPKGKQHQRVNPQGFLHPPGIPLTMDFQKQSDVWAKVTVNDTNMLQVERSHSGQ